MGLNLVYETVLKGNQGSKAGFRYVRNAFDSRQILCPVSTQKFCDRKYQLIVRDVIVSDCFLISLNNQSIWLLTNQMSC